MLRRVLSDPVARKVRLQDSMDSMRMHHEKMKEEYACARDAPDMGGAVLDNGIKRACTPHTTHLKQCMHK